MEDEMHGTRHIRRTVFLGAVLGVLLLLPTAHAQQGGKKEHAFRGKVMAVDTKAKSMDVDGENVEGWMAAMRMTYGVDKEEVIKLVKVGDQITAKVYEGDFRTLYEVKVVPPKPPSKK